MCPIHVAGLIGPGERKSVQPYVPWQRPMKRVERRAPGETWTEAAHQAGFSDWAHFSRTVLRMFGIPAASMMRPLP